MIYYVTGTSKTFTGLSSNTEYTYAVCAYNADGISAYDTLKTIRTLQSDIYGCPIFASDGQGVLQQYAEYDTWGGLNAGTEPQAGAGSRWNGTLLLGLESTEKCSKAKLN